MLAMFNPSSLPDFGITPQFAFVTIFIVVALVLLMTGGAVSRKAVQVDRKPCHGCGGENPGFAKFCRHCGKGFE